MAPSGWPSIKNSPKPIVPLFAALAIVAVGALFVGQLQQLNHLRQALTLSQRQVEQLHAEKEELSQQLEGLQASRKDLEDRVSSLRTELTSASTDLQQARAGLEQLKEKYQQLTDERSQLQQQLASATSERDEARAQEQHLEQGNAELTRAVSRLRERLALLDRDYRQLAQKLEQLQTSPTSTVGAVSAAGPILNPSGAASASSATIPQMMVELPPIIVRKDQAGMAVPVRGRLLEVSEPHHFVVVDKGSQDGVRVGMAFDILRGASAIGRATVVRVRPQLSACDVTRAQTPGPLQVGDLAVQSGP